MSYEGVSTTGQLLSQEERHGEAPSNGGIEPNPAPSPRKHERPDLERAHKTVTSSGEAPAGTPRSGSA